MSKPFTVKDGLMMQCDHMTELIPKLSAECFLALQKWVREQNRTRHYATGYDVVRGQDLTSFIGNWRPE